MRMLIALTAALSLSATACLSGTYKIPHSELEALAQMPPEARGQRVRIIQQFATSEQPPAAGPVSAQTEVVIVAPIHVGGGGGRPHGTPHPGGGGFKPDTVAANKADKAEALIILAAVAAIGLAATEGARYDGWVNLHPMHPVHLFGPYGEYTVMPLAQIDPQTAAWAQRAVIRDTEGPWRPLGRAPLDRAGWTYSVLLGAAEIPSARPNNTEALGFQGHIQFGNFPLHSFGLLLDIAMGWRQHADGDTIYDSHWGIEAQFLPVDAGPFHAGLFADAGLGARFEDYTAGGDKRAFVFGAGGLLQLELTTRLALTARAGINKAYGETTSEIGVGLSIY